MMNDSTKESMERHMAEDVWLNYFNSYLLENGISSEREYLRMVDKMTERKAKLSKSC